MLVRSFVSLVVSTGETITAGYSALVQEPSLPPATFIWKNRMLLYAKRPFGKQKTLISHLNIAYDNAR